MRLVDRCLRPYSLKITMQKPNWWSNWCRTTKRYTWCTGRIGHGHSIEWHSILNVPFLKCAWRGSMAIRHQPQLKAIEGNRHRFDGRCFRRQCSNGWRWNGRNVAKKEDMARSHSLCPWGHQITVLGATQSCSTSWKKETNLCRGSRRWITQSKIKEAAYSKCYDIAKQKEAQARAWRGICSSKKKPLRRSFLKKNWKKRNLVSVFWKSAQGKPFGMLS